MPRSKHGKVCNMQSGMQIHMTTTLSYELSPIESDQSDLLTIIISDPRFIDEHSYWRCEISMTCKKFMRLK